MTNGSRTILVVGGTGSVGRHVLTQLADPAFTTRAPVAAPLQRKASLHPRPALLRLPLLPRQAPSSGCTATDGGP